MNKTAVFETRDSEPAAPGFAEIRTLIEQQGSAFEEFKKANDQRLAELARNGAADPLTVDKVDRLNKALDETGARITGRIDDIETRLNRVALGQGGPGNAPALTPDQVEHRRAFDRFVRRGHEDGLREIEQRAMSAGSDPDGGYLAPADMSGRIVTRMFETSPMRQLASIQTISTGALEGMRDIDEVTTGWTTETGTRSETDTPQLGKWRIPVYEQYAEPRITQTLLDDAAVDVGAWLEAKIADKLVRTENTAFITGNGVGKPRGFADYTTAATADSSRSWGVIEHVATGTSGGYGTAPNGSDKLIDLVHKLKAEYRTGAVWAMNKGTLGTTRQLKANSEYIWLPSMVAGQPSQLLGYPVVEMEDIAAIAANSLSVWFGNFRTAYQIVDRTGVRVLRDPYTAKPYVKFYTTRRVGGDVVQFEAIKVLKFA